VACAVAASLACLAHRAAADEPTESPMLSLPPNAPQAGPVPGGIAPAYHQALKDRDDWRFDFHGMLMVPLRASFGSRPNPVGDQSKTTLHAPPVVPDYRDSFNYTGTAPQTYVGLFFTYGNPVVTGNISIVSRQPKTGASYFDPPLNPGIEDAYVNFNLRELMKNARFDVNVGAFTQRYGAMGEWDEGRYATPIIARTNGIGEAISATFAFGKVGLLVNQEIQGQADKPWNGIVPDYSNGFADSRTGAGWVFGEHVGLSYAGMATLAGHYMTAFTQDDRASQNGQPDGRIGVLGADLRLSLGRFGHVYAGGVSHNIDHARSIGRIIEVLNAVGGAGLMQNYLGPGSNMTGKLVTVAGQYDLSLARLIWYPTPFTGEAPDLVLSLFAMQTSVSSDDKSTRPDGSALYDGVTKRKLGVEASYGLLPWLGLSARYDQVTPDVSYTDTAFAEISPRILLRSGWNAHDQVALQYTHFIYGSQTVVRGGFPLADDPTIVPDSDLFALTASLWW
jgi:hypothetical protein